MAYTSEDVATIKSALLRAAQGKIVRAISLSDGTKRENNDVTIDGLRKLLSEAEADVGRASVTSATRGFFLGQTSKGL